MEPGTQPDREISRLYEGGTVGVKDSDPLQNALALRDISLSNELLAPAMRVRSGVDRRSREAADALAMHLFSGEYSLARKDLELLDSASVDPGDKAGFDQALELLRRKIPSADIAPARLLAQAAVEVLNDLSGDPFSIQEQLSRLVWGLSSANIPDPLVKLQVRLSKAASWLARERGLARRGPLTRPAQKYNDCWLRSLYDLPIAALKPLRDAMSYDAFLARVETLFPDKDIREKGLSFEDFPKLLDKIGLRGRRHLVSQKELESLLNERGAVIAGLAWFDKDVTQADPWEALSHWRQHAVVITGASDRGKTRKFVVRDSLLPHETRYTMNELDLLQLVVYSIEPAKS